VDSRVSVWVPVHHARHRQLRPSLPCLAETYRILVADATQSRRSGDGVRAATQSAGAGPAKQTAPAAAMLPSRVYGYVPSASVSCRPRSTQPPVRAAAADFQVQSGSALSNINAVHRKSRYRSLCKTGDTPMPSTSPWRPHRTQSGQQGRATPRPASEGTTSGQTGRAKEKSASPSRSRQIAVHPPASLPCRSIGADAGEEYGLRGNAADERIRHP
jgi:hypothetical protein